MGRAELTTFPTEDALAVGAAEAWIESAAAAGRAGRAQLVALSGGRIARKFFAAAVKLAAARGVDFSHVHFFWADERCVPPGDAESNFKLAEETLFQPARVPAANVHRIHGEQAPATAAARATEALRAVSGGAAMPVLDLVLLGMGEDGHVASLFPGQPDTEADMRSVFLPVFDSPKPPPQRVSLGHGAIASARAVWVLAAGAGKQLVLKQSLAAGGITPLARVIQRRAVTRVFTDLAVG